MIVTAETTPATDFNKFRPLYSIWLIYRHLCTEMIGFGHAAKLKNSAVGSSWIVHIISFNAFPNHKLLMVLLQESK